MTSQCKLFELPPVGEVDHKSGNCYYHLCTCGQHICPGDYKKSEKYLKSALRSIYKHDYTKKSGSVSEPYIRNTAMNPGCNKMDLKTISRQDFVEFKCEKTKTARYDKPDSSRVIKFAGVSHYRSEFPN